MAQQPEVNGCGAADSILDPPDFRFEAACNEHDLAYAAGGTQAERKAADRYLLRGMLEKAAAAPWYKGAYLYPAAWAYYGAVRVGGWRHWGKLAPAPPSARPRSPAPR